MARKSMVQLQNDLLTSFPDNTTGLITPAVVRAYFNNLIEAIRPAYGILSRSTPNAQTLTTTYSPIVFATGLTSDVPDYTTTPATGVLTRLEAGTSRATFNGGVQATNGTIVIATLFKDGVETTWKSSVTCTGVTEPIHLTLPSLEYDGSSTVYQLQAKVQVGSTSVTFNNLTWVIETVPVNAY